MDRFTTNLTKTEMTTNRRPSRYFDVAKQTKDHLRILLPHEACEAAIATCRFAIMGRDAHNDNGQALRNTDGDNHLLWIGQGRWIHTRLQTYGHLPSNHFRRTGTTDRSIWAISDCFAGADDILNCFGLNMHQVLDHYGNVASTERKVIDLVNVIEDMASGLLQSAAAAA